MIMAMLSAVIKESKKCNKNANIMIVIEVTIVSLTDVQFS